MCNVAVTRWYTTPTAEATTHTVVALVVVAAYIDDVRLVPSAAAARARAGVPLQARMQRGRRLRRYVARWRRSQRCGVKRYAVVHAASGALTQHPPTLKLCRRESRCKRGVSRCSAAGVRASWPGRCGDVSCRLRAEVCAGHDNVAWPPSRHVIWELCINCRAPGVASVA